MMWQAHAVIPGPAASQGSKRLVRTKSGHPLMIDDDKRLRSWRKAATDAMREQAPDEPIADRISVFVVVFVPRPLGHYGTGRNAGVLKASAPELPPSGRDVDKILRAILDAGTGIWWRDDRYVRHATIRDEYDGRERVEIVARLVVGNG